MLLWLTEFLAREVRDHAAGLPHQQHAGQRCGGRNQAAPQDVRALSSRSHASLTAPRPPFA